MNTRLPAALRLLQRSEKRMKDMVFKL
jgi:hypothetical protein